MTRIFSNGPRGDFVVNPYDRLIEKASQIYLAAPYYTESKQIVRGAAAGKKFQLLIGLNSVTDPRALESVYGVNNVSVRYLTHRFHAQNLHLRRCRALGFLEFDRRRLDVKP
jgi:hypothetical protein